MYMDDIKLPRIDKKTQVIRIYSQDIGMKFDIEKCDILIMRSGKRQITEVIE